MMLTATPTASLERLPDEPRPLREDERIVGQTRICVPAQRDGLVESLEFLLATAASLITTRSCGMSLSVPQLSAIYRQAVPLPYAARAGHTGS
jgi:hypothetical protein